MPDPAKGKNDAAHRAASNASPGEINSTPRVELNPAKSSATGHVALVAAKDEKTAAYPAAVNPAKLATLGAAVRAITARFEEAQRTGNWSEKPLWLDDPQPRGGRKRRSGGA